MSITLEEYKKDPIVAKRFEYNTDIKSKIRHKIVNSFEDFDDDSKEYLLSLKNEVFEGNDIYVNGSRIKGTYLTEEEYEKYSKEYTNVKKSDWDIQSEFKTTIKEYKGCKIDFQFGKRGIKV